jgi:hypothetical protein
MDQLHEIRVPAGIGEGQTFQIMIAGALMSVTCPAGVRAGDVIQASGRLARVCGRERDAGSCVGVWVAARIVRGY